MNQPLGGLRIGLLTAWCSRAGAGVAEAVAMQADMVRALGGEAVIFALDEAHAEADRGRYAPSRVHLSPVVGPAIIGFAPRLAGQMIAADLDLLHAHGIWMYPSRAGALWARATGKPYLISPHGMLDAWITRRGRMKKKVARLGYERDSWARAFAFHALSQHEADDILRETGHRESVIVPNPGPPALPVPAAGRAPHVVFISRIHPKKNVIALVEAWRQLDPQGGARLTIAGWGEEADVAALRGAIAAGPQSARFVGPVFGAEKQALLESARFVILPTHSEGLPITILEAWAAGAPTIMTEQCNLPEGFAAGAALPCGHSPAAIAEALRGALALDEPGWLRMAAAAHGLAAGPFARETVARRWGEVYAAAVRGELAR